MRLTPEQLSLARQLEAKNPGLDFIRSFERMREGDFAWHLVQFILNPKKA